VGRTGRTKRIAGRLLLGLLSVPLTFILTSPSSESPDRAYRYNVGGLGKRVGNITRQAESVAQGARTQARADRQQAAALNTQQP
jgi:hypothetical protein